MWTPTIRRRHSRDHLRYGSDLTDAERAIIAPFMPPSAPTGRLRAWPMREFMNAIFYVLRARRQLDASIVSRQFLSRSG